MASFVPPPAQPVPVAPVVAPVVDPNAAAQPMPAAVVAPPPNSADLTAKLQKLALERQSAQVADRLKVRSVCPVRCCCVCLRLRDPLTLPLPSPPC